MTAKWIPDELCFHKVTQGGGRGGAFADGFLSKQSQFLKKKISRVVENCQPSTKTYRKFDNFPENFLLFYQLIDFLSEIKKILLQDSKRRDLHKIDSRWLKLPKNFVILQKIFWSLEAKICYTDQVLEPNFLTWNTKVCYTDQALEPNFLAWNTKYCAQINLHNKISSCF